MAKKKTDTSFNFGANLARASGSKTARRSHGRSLKGRKGRGKKGGGS